VYYVIIFQNKWVSVVRIVQVIPGFLRFELSKQRTVRRGGANISSKRNRLGLLSLTHNYNSNTNLTRTGLDSAFAGLRPDTRPKEWRAARNVFQKHQGFSHICQTQRRINGNETLNPKALTPAANALASFPSPRSLNPISA
jgi:hypothetical protein